MPNSLARTIAVGLAGAAGGAALVMLSLPAELFGRVPPVAGTVTAEAREVAVVDGETLRLRETVVRLQGIHAPERGEACQAGADCGAAAAQALAGLVRDRNVACRLSGRDPAGFPQGLCEAGGTELNRSLVAAGFARARTEAGALGADLVAFGEIEAEARANRRGLWSAGAF